MSEPIHIISLGAGVQSSTMALMAAHGEITPMPKCAIFADTQAEPQSVYKWLDWLEKQLPFPVHRVTRGSLTAKILSNSGGIPAFTVNKTNGKRGIYPRPCTRDFKVQPIISEIRRIASIPRGCKEVRVIQWMGISRDEIIRMKPSRFIFIEHRYPLVDLKITREKCKQWMNTKHYPTPPRSACVYCPYHSDTEWRRLRDEEPIEFAIAVRVDNEFRRIKSAKASATSVPFLHKSCVPLDQVDFSTDEDHGQQVMFGNECDGMCGV